MDTRPMYETPYAVIYDTVQELQYRLQAELIPVAADTLLKYPHLRPNAADHRKLKALAATYELLEYLTEKKIAEEKICPSSGE